MRYKSSKFLSLWMGIVLVVVTPWVASATLRSAGPGRYEVRAKATMGIPVRGTGSFSVDEEKGVLVFRANVGSGLDMGIRDKHTNKEFGIRSGTELTLRVERKNLKLPAQGRSRQTSVKGLLKFRGVEKAVQIHYRMRRQAKAFLIESASFEFDYTNYRPDKAAGEKKICKSMICVEPIVEIRLKDVPLTLRDE